MENNEEDYLSLLREKQLANDIYNNKIVKAKKKIHKEFVNSNKKIILVLDIAMIFIILFNFGAVLITNALVLREEPDKVFMETNPVASKIGNYELHPESIQLMSSVLKQMFLWSILIFIYLYYRRNLIDDKDLFTLLMIITFWVTSTGYDFIHDFGYYIGKVIYGG